MANRYWVGGTATWDGTIGLKWALTSGGVGGQLAPTSADTVFFDANSGAGTVTLGTTGACQTINFTGYTGTFAWGSNTITVAGSGVTVYTQTTSSTFTGTPVLNFTYSGSTGTRTINCGSVTEANSATLNISAGGDTVTFQAASGIKNLNFTGFTGALSSSTTRTIYGNLTISSGMSLTAGTGTTTFGATSGTQTITSNSKNMDFPITFSGTATYQLVDDLSVGTSTIRNITFTGGTLDLNNKTLTNFGQFASSSTNTRSILFGTTGNYTNTCTSTSTVVSMATATGFTYTGTPTVNLTGNAASGVTRTVSFGSTAGGTETNSLNYNISAGSDSVALSGTFKNINFTGFTGTLPTSVRTIYGNLTLVSGMTVNVGANSTTFAATSGTQTITSATQTLDFPITFAGTATYQLADALTSGSGRTMILTSGTLDLNNNTITVGAFNSANSNTRSILFGTGNITITGSSGTLWNLSTITGFTLTGTPTVNLTDTGAGTTRTVSHGTGIASQAVSVYVKAGGSTSTVSFGSTNAVFKTIDLTGFSGTFVNSTIFVTGDFIVPAGVTITSANSLNFIGTTTQNITTNNVLIDLPITIGRTITTTAATGNGTTATLTYASTTTFPSVGQTITVRGISPSGYNGTYTVTASTATTVSYLNATTAAQTVAGVVEFSVNVQLVDALTMGSTRTLTLTNGTFNSNAKSVTVGAFGAINTNTKTLTLTNSTVTILSGNSGTSGFYITSTGSSVNNAGSSIVFTTSGVTSYYGGGTGFTWPQVTMSGTGQLIIGVNGASNIITTLSNTVQPCTISLRSTTNTTAVTNFNLNGTAGNLVTLNCDVAGTAKIISKSSGTVNALYLNIQDSTATGGAKWYANSSNDLGNNTGWNIFNNSFLAVF